MKKLSVLAVAFAAMVFVSCGGNKSSQLTEEPKDSVKSFEQQQIEAYIKMNIDSLAAEMGKLKPLPFLDANVQNTIKLTKEELLVKPDYLLPETVIEEAVTQADKYRLLGALEVDKKIAELYEMPTDGYDKAIIKLMADINDPSFKSLKEGTSVAKTTQDLYKAMEENGRINYFWQIAAASLVEQLYVISQNSDKLLVAFDDDTAANTTFRLILVCDALKRLKAYDPEIKPVADAMSTLMWLNATTVNELKSQLEHVRSSWIDAARRYLFTEK